MPGVARCSLRPSTSPLLPLPLPRAPRAAQGLAPSPGCGSHRGLNPARGVKTCTSATGAGAEPFPGAFLELAGSREVQGARGFCRCWGWCCDHWARTEILAKWWLEEAWLEAEALPALSCLGCSRRQAPDRGIVLGSSHAPPARSSPRQGPSREQSSTSPTVFIQWMQGFPHRTRTKTAEKSWVGRTPALGETQRKTQAQRGRGCCCRALLPPPAPQRTSATTC